MKGPAARADAWRPDIDGLRAVAVLPVLFFHAGIGPFHGGFVGVDVFFVISGFLITGILLRDLERGRFSIASFYVRRVRRIFPALVAVALAATAAGFVLLPPAHFVDFSLALQSLSTFTANHLFAAVQKDYWDQNALAHQPLLHTWSLAVEEQFYVVLPFLLWGLRRAFGSAWGGGTRATVGTLVLLSLASLGGAQWLLSGQPSWAFYSLPTRAWELLLGSLLAIWAGAAQPGAGSGPLREGGAALGLLLIGGAVLGFSEATPFPGLAALVPCLGAALLIAAGTSSGPATAASRLLCLPPVVFIGKLSYSLYLWHWPVLVLFKSIGWQARGWPAVPEALQLLLIALLSWGSWRYVEGPFRHGEPNERRWPVLSLGLALLVVGFLLGSVTLRIGRRGWPVRQPMPEVLAWLATDTKVAPGIRCEGASDLEQVRRDGGGCRVGVEDGDGPAAFVLIGDSHARMWTAAFDQVARERGLHGLVLSRSSCTPLPGVVPRTRPECRELTEATFAFVEASPTRDIVLAGYWSDITGSIEGRSIEEPLRAAITRLRHAGKRVFVLRDVPQWGRDDLPYDATIESIRKGGPEIRRTPQAEPAAMRAQLDAAVRTQEQSGSPTGSPPAVILDPWTQLCDEGGCLVARGQRTLYRDHQHLSDGGAIQAKAVFDPLFSGLTSPTAGMP